MGKEGMMHVAYLVAVKYAVDGATVEGIKLIHDIHVHYQNGVFKNYPPCPDCPLCTCPVPKDEHVD